MRLVFVGEEPTVRADVERKLADAGSQWEVVLAGSGAEALTAFSRAPAEVVVCHSRMGGTSGAELLERVQSKWPSTLRILLCDANGAGLPLRAVNAAHQLLSEPFEPAGLRQAVERIGALHLLLRSPDVEEMVGRLQHLPPAPRVHAQLTRALHGNGDEVARAVGIVQRDPALSAKVLQLANSVHFRRSRPIDDIRTAVTQIGVSALRTLVMATEVFGGRPPGVDVDLLQRRAWLASLLAARLAGHTTDAEAPATAALLADVGLLVPGIDVRWRTHTPGGLEVGHAEVGAYLLGLWGLPTPIVEAVAHHHAPERVPHDSFGMIGIVHVSVALATDCEPNAAYLERLGVSKRLEDWRRFCRMLRDVADH